MGLLQGLWRRGSFSCPPSIWNSLLPEAPKRRLRSEMRKEAGTYQKKSGLAMPHELQAAHGLYSEDIAGQTIEHEHYDKVIKKMHISTSTPEMLHMPCMPVFRGFSQEHLLSHPILWISLTQSPSGESEIIRACCNLISKCLETICKKRCRCEAKQSVDVPERPQRPLRQRP